MKTEVGYPEVVRLFYGIPILWSLAATVYPGAFHFVFDGAAISATDFGKYLALISGTLFAEACALIIIPHFDSGFAQRKALQYLMFAKLTSFCVMLYYAGSWGTPVVLMAKILYDLAFLIFSSIVCYGIEQAPKEPKFSTPGKDMLTWVRVLYVVFAISGLVFLLFPGHCAQAFDGSLLIPIKCRWLLLGSCALTYSVLGMVVARFGTAEVVKYLQYALIVPFMIIGTGIHYGNNLIREGNVNGDQIFLALLVVSYATVNATIHLCYERPAVTALYRALYLFFAAVSYYYFRFPDMVTYLLGEEKELSSQDSINLGATTLFIAFLLCGLAQTSDSTQKKALKWVQIPTVIGVLLFWLCPQYDLTKTGMLQTALLPITLSIAYKDRLTF